MDDPRRHDRPEVPDPSEGVRIIGEDEAAEALRSGNAAPRRGDDEPRYGDRPPAPEGPRPALRFPRRSKGDDEGTPTPRVADQADDSSLPHWTEPATGEVPRVLAGDEPEPESDDDLSAWSTFATGTPRWRDQPSDWEQADFGDASRLADETTRVGALDPRRARHDDLFDDIPEQAQPSMQVEEPAPPPPAAPMRIGSGTRDAPPTHRGGQPPGPGGGGPDEPVLGRNLTTAVGSAVAFAAVALFLFSMGPGPTMVLVAVVIVVAAAELYGAIHQAGFQPATLLGLVASGSLVAGAYWRGEAAFPLIVTLGVLFSFLWYLSGVSRVRPAVNAGMTIFGFCYVGLFGAFAALLLKWPNDNGIGLLLGAVLTTVAYDVGGFFIGRRIGQSPLAPEISPNKTYEGLVGGMAMAVLVGVILVSQIHPWDFGSALALGIATSIAAPIGDLAESMLKRDLGLKDVGSILPGHGGLLDRFDGLLFVLPTTYYLARVLDLGLG